MLMTRRAWRWVLLLTALTLAGVAGVVSVGGVDQVFAQSDQDCWQMRYVIVGEKENGDPAYGWRSVNVCESEGGGGAGSGPTTCEHTEYGEFPCHDQGRGWWSSTYSCYFSYLNPQPPAGHSDWDGHTPDEGAVYELYCPRGASGTERFARRTEFLSEAPELPSVSQLAQQAMERLPLASADIGIAPTPDGIGLVGLYVWLWTNNTAATWGPVSVRVPGPGFTVAAEGQATQIEWDMGDGTTVVCDGPGEPYRPEYGNEEPECGHRYEAPSRDQLSGRYQITATTTWHVEWWVEPRGGGTGDEDFFSRTSSTSVQINELQVVTS